MNDGLPKDASWLGWGVLLGPLVLTFCASLAFFGATRCFTGSGSLEHWFVILMPSVVLQAGLLLPLGFRLLAPSGSPPARRIKIGAWFGVVISLLLLLVSIPATILRSL